MADYAWPAAVVVISIAGIVVLRRELGALLGRLHEVTRTGFRFGSPRQETTEPQLTAADSLVRLVGGELVAKHEEGIRQELAKKSSGNLSSQNDELVHHLAATQVALVHEWTNTLIWGSQLEALRYLNAAPTGFVRDEFRPMFDAAATRFPDAYKNYGFDSWLAFLKQHNLVAEENGRYLITLRGRDLLRFLVATGRSGDRPF